MTLLTAGALTGPELPATDSFKPPQLQTCAQLVQGCVESAGRPHPNKYPGYASEMKTEEDVVIWALKMEVSGHQNIGRQQLGWNGAIQKGMKRQESAHLQKKHNSRAFWYLKTRYTDRK